MNILVLTSNYKADDLPEWKTPVVHYFVREWVAQGYNVLVIHNNTIFPNWLHLLLGILKRLSFKKAGYLIAPHVEEMEYILDNVPVVRLNISKKIPQKPFTEKSYQDQFFKLKRVLREKNFIPDVIVGHWITPQLRLVYELKRELNKPACLIIHEEFPILERDYPNTWKEYLNNMDLLGYRSKNIKNKFISTYKVNDISSFLCYSGIDENIIDLSHIRRLNKPIKTITFVGILIERKFPESILHSVNYLSNKISFKINYIGDGYLTSQLEKIAKKYDLLKQVTFHGRLSRAKVMEKLNQTDVFIMISERETFGLVYLEAMACGCITIAARHEGMDGIIVDGENGFLCKAGDWMELAVILQKIYAMNEIDISTISENAILKAHSMTDKNLAIKYIGELQKII